MQNKNLVRYLNLRTFTLLLFYTSISLLSYWAAYELRFDFQIEAHPQHVLDRMNTCWWVVSLQLMLLFTSGQFSSILSYFRLPDALRLFTGLLTNALILIFMWYLYHGENVPPRSIILTNFLISFLLLASFRVIMRIIASRSLEDWLSSDITENVIIIGAGEVGAALCTDLMRKTRLSMRPVAFLDDDPKKVGRYVHNILVADTVENIATVAQNYNASKAVIAFPSASTKRMRQVATLAREAGLSVDTVPALTDLVSGRAELSHLRPIQLEDLLGRDTVDLNSEEIHKMLAGKRVLVTGAGGSIGTELVRQILGNNPAELFCIDQAEIAIFNLQQNVIKVTKSETTKITTYVLDIFNTSDLEKIFTTHHPEVVFHAAAHKHVNLMEGQPAEALRNNFLATKQLAYIASQYQTERFILISSDKAINPTNVMGATKRLAELALIAQQGTPENNTKFMAVRFGNVLGSSGSVIPIFRKQIAAGGPVTVTDPEVTRFFMTVKEAVGLVLQSATQGTGGEIFVLDMGQSVKIIDVARQMIELSGLRVGTDIDIKFIGLQPGEKLYEEVQHLSEELKPTRHSRVMRFVAARNPEFDINQTQNELEKVMNSADVKTIKQTIHKHVPEYSPAV
jgi:FlaA1/EpsC-like NDP-sugar epimerase